MTCGPGGRISRRALRWKLAILEAGSAVRGFIGANWYLYGTTAPERRKVGGELRMAQVWVERNRFDGAEKAPCLSIIGLTIEAMSIASSVLIRCNLESGGETDEVGDSSPNRGAGTPSF